MSANTFPTNILIVFVLVIFFKSLFKMFNTFSVELYSISPSFVSSTPFFDLVNNWQSNCSSIFFIDLLTVDWDTNNSLLAFVIFLYRKFLIILY